MDSLGGFYNRAITSALRRLANMGDILAQQFISAIANDTLNDLLAATAAKLKANIQSGSSLVAATSKEERSCWVDDNDGSWSIG